MKVVIQIPCYNEEQTLEIALRALPRQLPGADSVEWLVINDGSTDKTEEVARRCGVDHVVTFRRNRGLAKAFLAGLDAALRQGADIIVNTDADNQYCAADIPKLVEPILSGQADMVIGARPIDEISHFSPVKRRLQHFGSWVVRMASGSEVADAPSGFRAISRYAAMRLSVFNNYTYTLETIIQAAQSGLRIISLPIRVNPDLRPSRLVKSISSYIFRSVSTIIGIFLIYRPRHFFFLCGAFPLGAGIVLMARWLYLNIYDFPITGRLHIPSLVVAAILVLLGSQLWLLGVLAELLATNRRILEDIRFNLRRQELDRE